MKETVTLNYKEQTRLMVLNQVDRAQLTASQAAEVLHLSLRQVRRLLAAYRKEGAAALAHGNRGRQPAHTMAEEVKIRVRELAQERYRGVNHCHLTELLAEREGIHLSRSTLRRLLATAGLKGPRRRRPPQHRSRRERYPQEGMLLQIDGSRHDWLQGRGPYLTLVGAIDDATGTVPFALFREAEDAQGYFLLLREVIRNKGIPLALYSDRHGIFQRSANDQSSLQEQLAGPLPATQFGRALQELGIQLHREPVEPIILAHSPQAKGRIERLWGTFQNRLVTELRLAGASTIEQANRVLRLFLPRFNARFAVPPADCGSAYRQRPKGLDLAAVLCFKYQRTAAADNTIRFGGHTLQLLAGRQRSSYARARVEVQERLDGRLVVYYQGQAVASREAPPHAVTLRARKGARPTASRSLTSRVQERSRAEPSADYERPRPKPSPNHPWRRTLLTKSLTT